LIEYRYVEGKSERYHVLAAQLVALKVDVIVVGNTPAALAAVMPVSFSVPEYVLDPGDGRQCRRASC